MKIEDNRDKTQRSFSNLIVGDIFTSSTEFYYMKTENLIVKVVRQLA